jgi:hypothetical protein
MGKTHSHDFRWSLPKTCEEDLIWGLGLGAWLALKQ